MEHDRCVHFGIFQQAAVYHIQRALKDLLCGLELQLYRALDLVLVLLEQLGCTQHHGGVHIVAGMPLPAGMVLVPGGGITMASCEQYHIVVHGKGGHGSMPNACIDPITAAAHIHIALQEINSRELDPAGFGVFTTGRFEAGKASNVIPDTADMWGTIRTVDPEQKVCALIHQRMTEIAQGVATAYRCTAEVEFSDYCPCMVVDTPLAGNALTYMTELLGKGAMDMTPLTGGKPGGGSEDFPLSAMKCPP